MEASFDGYRRGGAYYKAGTVESYIEQYWHSNLDRIIVGIDSLSRQ
ncbi:MAG: hypothetical protein GY810_08075 [Aureispira sp.]|nr:hypothetical protein [Aureispira sp.]